MWRRSTETSLHTRSTRRHIPEYGILHSHRRENLKSYISSWLCEITRRENCSLKLVKACAYFPNELLFDVHHWRLCILQMQAHCCSANYIAEIRSSIMVTCCFSIRIFNMWNYKSGSASVLQKFKDFKWQILSLQNWGHWLFCMSLRVPIIPSDMHIEYLFPSVHTTDPPSSSNH
jgi:hypothetical protein